MVQIKAVPEDIVRRSLQIGIGIFGGAPGLAFFLLKRRAEISQTEPGLDSGHIRVHISNKQVHQPVLIEIKKFDTHRAPWGLGKIKSSIIDKKIKELVLKIM